MKCCWKRLLALLIGVCLLCGGAWGEDLETMLTRAQDYIQTGEMEKAMACLRLAARIDPDDPRAYLEYGRIMAAQEKYPQALEAIDQALKCAPALGDAWALRFVVNGALGNGEEAESDALFAEVCGIDMNAFQDAWAGLGLHWYQEAQYARAISCFDMAGLDALDEAQKKAYKVSLLRMGNPEQAEALGLVQMENRDALLDAAFESGMLKLQEIPWIPSDLSGLNFVCPSFFWKYNRPEDFPEAARVSPDGKQYYYPLTDSMTEAFFREQFTPISISPDGQTILLTRMGDGLFAMIGKEIRYLYINPMRGAENTYGKLAKYQDRIEKGYFPGEEGVIWSPDSRYAVMPHYQRSLIYADMTVDPIIIDTWTGEIFLAASYPIKLVKGGGSMLQARFDQTGRYLYYGLMGGGYEYRNSIMRYDLETGENQLCYTGGEFFGFPALWELPDGCLMNLSDVRNLADANGLNVYEQIGETWENNSRSFTLRIEYWYPRELAYSIRSGYALVAGNNRPKDENQTNFTLLSRIRTEMDFEGMDTYWYIENLDSPAASAVTFPIPMGHADLNALIWEKLLENHSQEELEALDESERAALAEQELTELGNAWTAQTEDVQELMAAAQQKLYAQVLRMALSPDGYYALLYCIQGQDAALLLMNLETMALCRVEAPREKPGIYAFGSGTNTEFNPCIAWQADGRLLIRMEDAGVRVYSIQQGK